jgi:hypothetical protein
VTLAGCVLSAPAGLLVAVSPARGLGLAIAASVLAVAVARPQPFLLAMAVGLSFVSTASAVGFVIPSRILSFVVISAAVASLLGGSVAARADAILLALLPVSLVAIRMFVGGESGSSATAGLCALFALVGVALAGYQRMSVVLGLGALLFALTSTLLASTADTSSRLAGISGNPNRMVLGILALAPFVVAQSGLRWRVAAAAYCVVGLSLIVQSGSAQAIPGLLALVIGVLFADWRRIRAARWHLATVARALAVGVLGVVALTSALNSLGPKLASSRGDFSGRAAYFATAWQEFAASPVVGNGSFRVVDQLGAEKSAHNMYLALLAGGGLLVAVPGIVSLGAGARAVLRQGGAGNPAATSFLVTAVIGLVQGIELLPWLWFILAYLISLDRNSPGPGVAAVHQRANAPSRHR